MTEETPKPETLPPHIHTKGSIAVELEEGKKYFFCTCGHSQKQPFCDGAHKTTGQGLRSHPFVAEKTGTHWLCQCKHSGKIPFCDGSHKKLA